MADNLDPTVDRAGAKVMSRADLTRRLVSRLDKREAVIGGIGYANFELFGAGDRHENFYMLGSMGLAVPIALGVALAQPRRRVFALEGDGSIMMYLGALATVADRRPPNLAIVIFDNGAYQITGGQPALTATVADVVSIAKGCGLSRSRWAADEAHFDYMVERALAEPGPWLIAVRIDGAKPEAVSDRDPPRIRRTFSRAMQNPV
jgi:thiamine pyrophosphate-dependent acetolactate synthase large subunit-like protein